MESTVLKVGCFQSANKEIRLRTAGNQLSFPNPLTCSVYSQALLLTACAVYRDPNTKQHYSINNYKSGYCLH